uniref:Uncharacterized protein n=1 Tax=Tanacetum cinerariifolium TaxID=118510 RepID=A0A699JL10_TANCI|nr:hypothetical protein [Tanacetum cinerariifolium]
MEAISIDKKKVVVTDAAIREVLWLDDAEDVDCLPNKEIFIELARIGDLSTHTTKYALPTLTQKVFANMRRVGKGFSRVETPLFEGMLVGQAIKEEGDANEHVEQVTSSDDAHGDDTAAHGEVLTVTQEPSIPSPTPTIPPSQPPQDIPLISQRVDTSDDTVIDDESNQRRMIDEMDKDDDGRQTASHNEIYKIDMDHASKVLSMHKDKPTEVHEVVDVVTTAKLITKVDTAASEIVTPGSAIISNTEPQVPVATITAALVRVAAAPSRRRKGVVIRDPKKESTTSSIISTKTKSKDKGKGIMDVAIDHVKLKAKEDPAVKRYQATKRKPQTEAQARKNMMMYLTNVAGFKLDYFKGMSYDNIRLIFEAKFKSNVDFLLKTKEQMEEEENRALQSINETPAEKAAKRRKLNEEVENLKRHLEIVPDNDNVYIEATPLARKVLVVDYEIIELNNKPYYKIIRANGTHQLYISFLTLVKNFDREDLEEL